MDSGVIRNQRFQASAVALMPAKPRILAELTIRVRAKVVILFSWSEATWGGVEFDMH